MGSSCGWCLNVEEVLKSHIKEVVEEWKKKVQNEAKKKRMNNTAAVFRTTVTQNSKVYTIFLAVKKDKNLVPFWCQLWIETNCCWHKYNNNKKQAILFTLLDIMKLIFKTFHNYIFLLSLGRLLIHIFMLTITFLFLVLFKLT